MDYCEMERFVKLSDLVYNRVGICNEILGCRYSHACDNPLRLRYSHGRYVVTYLGDKVCDYGVWHVDEAAAAYDCLDAWSRCLWLVRRAGNLLPVA